MANINCSNFHMTQSGVFISALSEALIRFKDKLVTLEIEFEKLLKMSQKSFYNPWSFAVSQFPWISKKTKTFFLRSSKLLGNYPTYRFDSQKLIFCVDTSHCPNPKASFQTLIYEHEFQFNLDVVVQRIRTSVTSRIPITQRLQKPDLSAHLLSNYRRMLTRFSLNFYSSRYVSPPPTD